MGATEQAINLVAIMISAAALTVSITAIATQRQNVQLSTPIPSPSPTSPMPPPTLAPTPAPTVTTSVISTSSASVVTTSPILTSSSTLQPTTPSTTEPVVTPQVTSDTLYFSANLQGFAGTDYFATGRVRDLLAGLSASSGVTIQLRNAHLYIRVNSITTGGGITISGTAKDENSGGLVITSEVVPIGDSPNNADEVYQTSKKWFDVTSVTLGGSIIGINYDVGELQYWDMFNSDWTLVGYEMFCVVSSSTSDGGIRIINVIPVQGALTKIETIELIGWDSTNGGGGIADGYRSGIDDRSYTSPVTFANADTEIHISQKNMTQYINATSLEFKGTGDGGMILQFVGVSAAVIPSGVPTGVTHCGVAMLVNFFE